MQAPPPPEMKVTNFLCWAFASAPVSVRVPSLPPHRDLEEWGGEAVGLRVLVGVYVSDLCLPEQQVSRPLARPTFLMPLTRTWGWVVTSMSLKKGTDGPCHHRPLKLSSACGPAFLVLGQNPWRLLPESIWLLG